MVDYLMLILLHLIGDFYLKTTKIAQCKNAKKVLLVESVRNVKIILGLILDIY